MIAVIDLHEADEIDASNGTTKIHWVPSLKLNTGDNYRGYSELLVWGGIAEDAILSTVSSTQILACMDSISDQLDTFHFSTIQTAKAMGEIRNHVSRHRPTQTLETGVAIGQLARAFKIPRNFLEVFVRIVVSEWRFGGSNWETNDAFIHGVVSGFEEVHEAQPRSFEDFYESLKSYEKVHEAQHRPFEDFYESLESYEETRKGGSPSRENGRGMLDAEIGYVQMEL